MSDTPIRRTNCPANPQGDESDDPLAEPESIVGRSAQRFEPEGTAEELAYSLFGFSGDQFEAAFLREGSVSKKEPVFEEPLPQDYSQTFAQTFEEEMAGSPGTSGQEVETRARASDFGTRFVTVMAVPGLVLVAAVVLIYSWVGVKNTGEPIVTKADTSPVKKMAEAETEQPSSNKLIYHRLGSTDDSNNEKIVSRDEQPVAAAATPSGQNSVAERVRNPSDVASPLSLLTPSIPPMQSEPAVAEPSAAPEPAPPLPETVDTEADRVLYHAGTDAPRHAPPPVGTPPAGTYTIQHGDTLMAIAAHFYGDASQWSVIAQANPKADPRRLLVGQEIKLPPTRPSPSR